MGLWLSRMENCLLVDLLILVLIQRVYQIEMHFPKLRMN